MKKTEQEAKQPVATKAEKPAPEKKKEKQAKNAKPNIFVRFGRKCKEVFSELKKVTWPTPDKIFKSTGIVIGVVLIFMVIVTAIDAGLGELLALLTNTAQ